MSWTPVPAAVPGFCIIGLLRFCPHLESRAESHGGAACRESLLLVVAPTVPTRASFSGLKVRAKVGTVLEQQAKAVGLARRALPRLLAPRVVPPEGHDEVGARLPPPG